LSSETRYLAEERDLDRAAADMVRLWSGSLASTGVGGPAKLDWFYRSAPAGPGRAVVLLAAGGDGTAVVGCLGIGFRRVYAGDRVLRAALLADLAVDPAHRTVLPALTLVRRGREVAAASSDFQYGSPNRKAIGVFKRLEYRTLGTLARRARVLRFAPYVSRRVRFPWLSRAGGAVLDAAAGARWLWPHLRAAVGFRLSFLPGPDTRFDTLFDAARGLHGVIGDRGRDFLRWRFFLGQGSSRLAALERRSDGELRAYAVVTVRDGVAHLSDFLGASDADLAALLALLLPALRAEGCTSASARFLGAARIGRVLERAGFRLRDTERAVVIEPGGDTALAAILGDAQGFYLTDADEDE
jgi:hypothetical protein